MSLITQSQLDMFEQDGYLIVPNVIDTDTINNIRLSYAKRVAHLLTRYQKLACGDGASGNFEQDMQHILSVAPQAYQHLDISLPMLSSYNDIVDEWKQVLGEDWQEMAGFFADEAIHSLIVHPNIVDIARQFIGEEIIASPVQHTRIKPPQHLIARSAQIDANTARTLWHQDEAVVSEQAHGVEILTVWVAITDATIENGCMEALRGSHQNNDNFSDFGLVTHCPGQGHLVGEIYIDESLIPADQRVPLIVEAGDVVLLHRRTVHGAGANTSNAIRWSFDLRYQPASLPTGRDFFPSCTVSSHDDLNITSAEQYFKQWQNIRNDILAGNQQTIFNERWNKYSTAPLCA